MLGHCIKAKPAFQSSSQFLSKNQEEMKDAILTLSLLLVLLTHSLSEAYTSAQRPLAPAIYIFGASTSDSGNNNVLPTQAKANYQPYGVDFVLGPTGRFTNGKNIVDFIAEFLGLPLAPPYLGLSDAERSKITTGLNYASGGAGILPETGSRVGRIIPLPEQVDNFQRTVEQYLPQHFLDQQALLDHLTKSIFTFFIGTNDYINNYLQPNFYNSSRQYSPQAFAELLVDKLFQQLKRVYSLGARKFVVFELFPLGCLPVVTNANNFSGVCSERVNGLALEFNSRLLRLVSRLDLILPGSNFVYGLAYQPGLTIYHNPALYGFRYTNVPCCETANHGTTLCIPGGVPCPNRSDHIFWDAIHVTQAFNAIQAVKCFNQTAACIPMNIQQLAWA